NAPPKQVSLRYSEAVEPRFAIVSVTNVAGGKETAGAPSRSPSNADTLVVPLKQLYEGWYLVYWRVISVDGHPVRGAVTFAVGPGLGVRPWLARPRARLRALCRSRGDRDLARPARAAPALARGLDRTLWRAGSRGGLPARAGHGRARRSDHSPWPLARVRLVPSR